MVYRFISMDSLFFARLLKALTKITKDLKSSFKT